VLVAARELDLLGSEVGERLEGRAGQKPTVGDDLPRGESGPFDFARGGR
jgi:hypothetical protein